jgi:DNA-binding NarL/FixJ family response regulator
MQAETQARRPKSVVVIDDHDIVRFGIETLVHGCPDLRLAGSADSVEAGVRIIAALHPDLVISDMGTRDSRGLDTVRAIVAAQAPRPVLIVSVNDEMLYGAQAIALGAKGYLMKESAHASVIPAALSILEGGTWVSPRLNAKLVGRLFSAAHAPANDSDGTSLSAREFDVLQLLKCGMSTKQIASALQVSVRTVDIHRASMKRKLGLRTGAELIAFASSRL